VPASTTAHSVSWTWNGFVIGAADNIDVPTADGAVE